MKKVKKKSYENLTPANIEKVIGASKPEFFRPSYDPDKTDN